MFLKQNFHTRVNKVDHLNDVCIQPEKGRHGMVVEEASGCRPIVEHIHRNFANKKLNPL